MGALSKRSPVARSVRQKARPLRRPKQLLGDHALSFPFANRGEIGSPEDGIEDRSDLLDVGLARASVRRPLAIHPRERR